MKPSLRDLGVHLSTDLLQESVNKIESVQRHFLSHITGQETTNLDFWERLKLFKLSSQERRRERYMIIFLWKISQGLVSGYGIDFTSIYGRREVVKTSSAMVRKARESSI